MLLLDPKVGSSNRQGVELKFFRVFRASVAKQCVVFAVGWHTQNREKTSKEKLKAIPLFCYIDGFIIATLSNAKVPRPAN